MRPLSRIRRWASHVECASLQPDLLDLRVDRADFDFLDPSDLSMKLIGGADKRD